MSSLFTPNPYVKHCRYGAITGYKLDIISLSRSAVEVIACLQSMPGREGLKSCMSRAGRITSPDRERGKAPRG